MPLSRLRLNYSLHAHSPNHQLDIIFDTAHSTQRFMYSVLARGQTCDPPLCRALLEPLQPGDTFLDIGSHVGYLSLLALQEVGPSGRVFAFEPNPETFRILTLNALINRAGHLHALNCALSDRSGTATFHVNETAEGMSSLHDGRDETRPDYRDLRPIQVMTATLDELDALDLFDKVRVVKIDVEGFEMNVIRGGLGFFQRHRPEVVVFEVNNSIPGQPAGADRPIRDLLHGLGYDAYLIRPWPETPQIPQLFGDRLLLPLPRSTDLSISYANILMRRSDAAPAP